MGFLELESNRIVFAEKDQTSEGTYFWRANITQTIKAAGHTLRFSTNINKTIRRENQL